MTAVVDQMTAAINAREAADTETVKSNHLGVNGAKGGPAFGEGSGLYEATGYV